MPFSHIVKQGSTHDIGVGDAVRNDRQGSVISVPLVVIGLFEKDLGELRREPTFDCRPLGGDQRFC